MIMDQQRGYDVGTSLDTLGFQKDSLQIDLDFFVHMKDVYIKKLYGDLYKYCEGIIDNALTIEEIPQGFTKEQMKTKKIRSIKSYPAPKILNPNNLDLDGNPIEGQEEYIEDLVARFDMNEIFALTNAISANLRELDDDIGTFTNRIANCIAERKKGF